MDRDIQQQNEATAIRKIREAYRKEGMLAAMQLAADFMGLDAHAAFETVNNLCKEEPT